MRTVNSTRLLPLILALVAGACAGGTSNGSRGGGGHATAETFAGDTAEFMRHGLEQFAAEDVSWPGIRAEWLALGKRESEFLVQAMFAALVGAQQRDAPHLVERARSELTQIGAPCVPFLTDLLAAGYLTTVYDQVEEVEKSIRVDDDMRREAAQILTAVGAPAAAETARVVDRGESKGGRRFALKALGDMGDRGGDAARNGLIRGARNADWVLRVEAMQGLASFSGAATRAALEAGVSDEDDLVRRKAADSLGLRRETASLPVLRAAHARARDAGRIDEMRRIERALAAIEAQR